MYQNLHTLRSGCIRCKRCALHQTRAHVVFGEGAENANVLLVGEAPGAKEDEQGRPFIGRGGQLLNRMMEEAGIDRDAVFITNLVKCRPPENRDPSPAEQETCRRWLMEQIRLLRPSVVVCIGRIAAMALIRKDYKVTKEHGIFYAKDGCTFVGMYHPAAVLRSPRLKEAAQADFYKLKAFLEEQKK